MCSNGTLHCAPWAKVKGTMMNQEQRDNNKKSEVKIPFEVSLNKQKNSNIDMNKSKNELSKKKSYK